MCDSANMMVIGVYSGGTGCRAAIGTIADGVLARTEGGRANVSTGPDLAIRNVRAAVDLAATKSGTAPEALKAARADLGLAGGMAAKERNRIALALLYCQTKVTDERPTVVTGALGDEDGYLLSVGTGTIVAANAGGICRYIGGWGFHVSDQASGAWLGRAALERILLCHDGLAKHTDLTRALFAHFGDDPNKIVSFSMSAKPGDYGALTPDIVAAGQNGDSFGRYVMTQGADYLSRSLSQLGFQTGDVLCLTGGLGPHYAQYLPRETLTRQITLRGSALDGAFELARSAATQLESNAL